MNDNIIFVPFARNAHVDLPCLLLHDPVNVKILDESFPLFCFCMDPRTLESDETGGQQGWDEVSAPLRQPSCTNCQSLCSLLAVSQHPEKFSFDPSMIRVFTPWRVVFAHVPSDVRCLHSGLVTIT
jgi:hypothetical protein